jgi:hypothetical protein
VSEGLLDEQRQLDVVEPEAMRLGNQAFLLEQLKQHSGDARFALAVEPRDRDGVRALLPDEIPRRPPQLLQLRSRLLQSFARRARLLLQLIQFHRPALFC